MAYVGNQPLTGLRPINNGIGNATPRVREFAVSSTYATAIGEGCLLIKTAAGVNLATDTIAAGGFIVGVAVSNNPAYASGSTAHQSVIAVYDDPNQEFAVVSDGTMTATVQIEMVGQFTRLTTTTNVYTATFDQGASTLDISTVVSTRSTTRTLQIVGIVSAVGDTHATTQAGNVGQVIVKIPNSNHIWASDSVTYAT